MRYSIELRDTIYDKSYRSLSFDKNIGRNVENKRIIITKISMVNVVKRSWYQELLQIANKVPGTASN